MTTQPDEARVEACLEEAARIWRDTPIGAHSMVDWMARMAIELYASDPVPAFWRVKLSFMLARWAERLNPGLTMRIVNSVNEEVTRWASTGAGREALKLNERKS